MSDDHVDQSVCLQDGWGGYQSLQNSDFAGTRQGLGKCKSDSKLHMENRPYYRHANVVVFRVYRLQATAEPRKRVLEHLLSLDGFTGYRTNERGRVIVEGKENLRDEPGNLGPICPDPICLPIPVTAGGNRCEP